MKIRGRKITSLFVAVAMLLAMLPTFGAPLLAAPAGGVDTRVTDTATMNDWTKYFGPGVMSTVNAGGVWTDKSVLTSADAFAGTGITMNGTDNESFLVALSAIASSSSITGKNSLPTDTMLVLDVSGSMNNNTDNNDAAEDLVNAANASIAKLLAADSTNRVGVVLYSGTNSSTDGNANAAVLLLPLGRYTATSDAYLRYRTNSGDEYITTGTTLREEGKTSVFTSTTKEVVGATYIQKGIQLATEQFTAASNNATGRIPIMILMSDGAPTLASSNFTSPGTYAADDYWAAGGFDLGNGSSTSAALGFATQLTAAYAKEKIEEKYGDDLLFYTLGFKVNTNTTAGQIAQSVLDPKNSVQGIDDFWAQYNAAAVGGKITLRETGYWKGFGRDREWVDLIVQATKIDTALTQNYVTGYYSATGDLTGAFDQIVGEALLQAKFFPTLIKDNEDLSGYISFVDKIGHYMEVTDVKGILIHNTLFSGSEVASHIVDNVGDLGEGTDTSTFNAEFVNAVMARLGITDPVVARTLIKNAVRDGQIHYTNENDYSNYIGWYANAAGKYLGYWHEGTTVPETTGDAATDPVYYVKSYGYLGEVDAEHGVSDTDMMYTTVQVRQNIKTGDVIVTFAVPAALIPVVSYDVTLDDNEELIDLAVSGAQHPIRLVYEVALKDGIDAYTVHDNNVVDQAYVAEHTDPVTGAVYFYTNQYEVDNTTGYSKDNTYSYFNPAKENSRYYYTEPSNVYIDENGTLYTGTAKPDENGTFYRAFTAYEKSGTALVKRTAYERISVDSLKKAVYHANEGHWDIPAGTVHTYTGGYTVAKTTNATGTLPWRDVPFVDVTNHDVNESGYYYYVGATLGNNGRVAVTPATGLAITKAIDGTATTTPFTFVITGTAADANQSYPARLVAANGTAVEMTVTFGADSKATVALKSGEGLFISGMTAGRTYTITENDVVDYIVGSVNGNEDQKSATVTIVEKEIVKAEFVNIDRGEGTLTVAKVVRHNLGNDYVIPANKTFNMTVTLNGIGTASTTFAARLSDAAGTVTDTTVTTDASGAFTVNLKAGEQMEIDGLPIGTTATVVEGTPGNGFMETYYDNGERGDGVVTIDGMNSVIVVNTYTPAPVYPDNLKVGGTKNFVNEDGSAATWGPAQFTVILQRRDGDSWMDVERIILDSAHQTFTFDLSSQMFDAPGVYAYQIIEELPDEASRVEGVLYDREIHTFSVTVTDDDMDGELEIARVHSEHADKDFPLVGGSYTVDVTFTNTQYNTTPAVATFEIQKLMTNASGSPIAVLNGFEFGLYTDAACTTEAVVGNGITAIHGAHTDTIGEGRISVTFDKTGTYIFYIKEKTGNIPNMTYSTQVVRAAVTVQSGLQGRLTANTMYNTATNAEGELEFTNVYAPKDATLVIDTVSKVLNGRDMIAGEFEFAIIPYGETTAVATGKNDTAAADGQASTVTFAPALTYDKVGEYYYNVVETSTDGNGVTVQKTPFRIIVTVTDVNGQLTATYTVVNHVGNDMVFTNTYTATPATYTVRGNKTLVGKAMINDEFTFAMAEADATGALVAGGKTYTTTNFADGHFVFETLTFDKAGTYYYVVSEKAESTGLGIKYDDTAYLVAITVTDDGLGTLTASATVDGNAAKPIAFVNTYVAKPVSLTVDGGKTLVGKILSGGDYAFELYASDAAWTLGALLETAQNDVNGDFAFTKFGKLDAATNTYVFDTTGDYYYVIKEQNGGADIDGVLYDKTEYRIWVEVTDDLKGYLHTVVHFYDQSGIPQSGVSFENQYRITSGDTVKLEGTKEITGREMTANDVFSFNLFEADASFTIGNKLQTVQNNGKNFKFEIAYDSADAGKTFYYVVAEDKAGEKANGLTNSTATYNVTVTVTDDGDGTMTATANIANGPIRFVNTYQPKAAEYTVTANKTLTGKTLKDNDFTFVMQESDANGNVTAGAKSYEAKNKADGTITFEKLIFDRAGTHYYVVSETAGAANVGITYDTTTFLVAITVTDDGLGTLTAAATVDGSATKTIGFVNAYVPTAANVTIPGDKVLTGKVLNGADYAFELYASDAAWTSGALLETVENDVNGDFAFTKIGTLDTVTNVYAFTEAGDYYYLIKEKNGGQDIDGVLYDATVYRVHVKITDDLVGALHREVKLYDATGADKTAVAFKNEYRITTGDTLTLEGEKVITGREMTANDVFSFNLFEADASFTVGNKLQTVQNNGKNFKFEIAYDAADAGKTFYYVVAEDKAGETESGLTNSTATYQVTVNVKDNGDGTMTAAATVANGPIRFVNTYASQEASVELDVGKELIAKELQNGAFTFLLYPTNGEFVIADTAVPQTATNDADGVVKFNTLTFNEAGTYYYVLKEDTTVDAENITFDQSVYQIVITVEDDGVGHLIADTAITLEGETDVMDEIVFTNVYTPELPQEPEMPDNPQTGVRSNLLLMIALMFVSGGILSATAFGKKRAESK